MADATVSRPSGRGKFISFEGGEGSAPTRIWTFADHLDDCGKFHVEKDAFPVCNEHLFLTFGEKNS
jgi:hypothetical protein